MPNNYLMVTTMAGIESITDLLDPAAPRVGLFGVHDGKRFAGLLAYGESFMRLHKNSLSLKVKMKRLVGTLVRQSSE